jgi:hypothetical protein
MDLFEQNLSAICEMYDALEHWPRRTVTVPEVAVALGQTRNEVIKLFGILNITPPSWESPSDYEVATILEATCRHEVSRRFSFGRR